VRPIRAIAPRLLPPLLLAAAALACNGAEGKTKDDPAAAGPGGGGPPAMPVEVVAARTDTVVDAILATGQIEAFQAVELRPEIEGRIAEILVREGTPVGRGTPLFKVDDAELKAEVARAEAERDLARQSLARTKELLGQKASSQSGAGAGGGDPAQHRGSVRAAQGAAGQTVVRPVYRYRGERLVSLGDYVTTDTRLVSLQTVSPQRAAFQVPERYADQLKIGQRVTFRVAALPGKEFIGRVDFVDPVVQLPGRTITVKAVVPNPGRELQSGMFIEARLATAVRPSAVVIPEDAVIPLQGSTFVWVITQGKATRRQVDLGVRTPGFVEARTGVEPAEHVVVGGQERLAEGSPVMPKVVERVRAGGREDSATARPQGN
jgi:membrane fusion protein (multidrug efflux system)